ncbi:MAG: DUF4198 domain-containing protein [Bacteroidota bacterium]
MKRTVITLIIALFIAIPGFAHYMWLEISTTGSLEVKHEVKVYFGEYTYGILEKTSGDAYKKVANFKLWVIAPDGTKMRLKPMAGTDHYTAYFTPEQEGVYTVILNNNEIEVIDYTQYDFGIFKTHYHATSKVSVEQGSTGTATLNPEGLVVKQLANEDNRIKLQVLFKGQPLKEHEFKVFVADHWSKTLYTDENGEVVFSLPWTTKYIVEATKKEEVPGTYKGKDYEFIWHCATLCLP